MKNKFKYFIISLVFLANSYLYAQTSPHHFIENVTKIKSVYGQLSYIKKNIAIIKKYSNNSAIDSLVDNTISLAIIAVKPDSLLSFFKVYFDEIEISRNGYNYANEYLNIATLQKKTEDIATANIALFNNLDHADLAKMREIADNAKFYAEKTKNKDLLLKAMICQADILNFENKKIAAYRILNASLIDNKIDSNAENLLIVQNRLLEFYINNNNLKKAETTYEEQRKLLARKTPVDSLEIIKSLFQLCKIYNLNDNLQGFKVTLNLVLEYCIKHVEEKLQKDLLVLLRKEAFDKNNFDLLNEFYFIKYPHLLQDVAKNDRITYFKILAMQCESKGQMDSCISFLNQVKEMNSQSSPFSQANLNYRLGEFYERNNRHQDAIKYFYTSYSITDSLNYYPWIKKAAEKLNNLYAKEGNYQSAYYYSQQTILYTDSISKAANLEKQLELDIENEILLSSKMEERRLEKALSKKNDQYFIAFLSVVFLFLILLVISSTKFPKIAIRGLAYISFILLFEFIILGADDKIHRITHGNTLGILGIKIVLVGIILPFHHWVENKVLQYLYNHRIFEVNNIKNIVIAFKEKIFSIYKPDILVEEKRIEPSSPKEKENG